MSTLLRTISRPRSVCAEGAAGAAALCRIGLICHWLTYPLAPGPPGGGLEGGPHGHDKAEGAKPLLKGTTGHSELTEEALPKQAEAAQRMFGQLPGPRWSACLPCSVVAARSPGARRPQQRPKAASRPARTSDGLTFTGLARCALFPQQLRVQRQKTTSVCSSITRTDHLQHECRPRMKSKSKSIQWQPKVERNRTMESHSDHNNIRA